MANNLIEINFNTDAIAGIERAMRNGANRTPDAIRRAINRVGDKAHTQVARAIAEQTNLKKRVAARAVKPIHANYGSLTYRLRALGGNIRLKYFIGTRETQRGVSAAPMNERRIYAGTFMKGGSFLKGSLTGRVALNMGGQVLMRTGTGRRLTSTDPKIKSGVYLANELTKGETVRTFFAIANAELPARIEHELAVVLAGIVS